MNLDSTKISDYYRELFLTEAGIYLAVNRTCTDYYLAVLLTSIVQDKEVVDTKDVKKVRKYIALYKILYRNKRKFNIV